MGIIRPVGIERKPVPFLEDDRPLVYDIEKIDELLNDGSILDAVESAVGEIELGFGES